MAENDRRRHLAQEVIGLSMTPREVESFIHFLSGRAPDALADALTHVRDHRAPAVDYSDEAVYGHREGPEFFGDMERHRRAPGPADGDHETCLGRDMDCGRRLPCPDHPPVCRECKSVPGTRHLDGCSGQYRENYVGGEA